MSGESAIFGQGQSRRIHIDGVWTQTTLANTCAVCLLCTYLICPFGCIWFEQHSLESKVKVWQCEVLDTGPVDSATDPKVQDMARQGCGFERGPWSVSVSVGIGRRWCCSATTTCAPTCSTQPRNPSTHTSS